MTAIEPAVGYDDALDDLMKGMAEGDKLLGV